MASGINEYAEHSRAHGRHTQQLSLQQDLLQIIRIGSQFIPLQTYMQIAMLGILQSKPL